MLIDLKNSPSVCAKTSQRLLFFDTVIFELLVSGQVDNLYIGEMVITEDKRDILSQALHEICAYADQHKVVLNFTVAFADDINTTQQVSLSELETMTWLATHGFELDETNIMPNAQLCSIEMVRFPMIQEQWHSA